jgi:transketolase
MANHEQQAMQTESIALDVRDALFNELCAIAAKDPRVMLLTDDQGAFGLDRFKRETSSQYLNVGIAEQNLISVAAGLALGGKIPFVYGITPFMAMRCCEQIKVDLCCMKLPVTILGSGTGYSYASDGPTHHATQDVAIIRTLPAISIYNPADAETTACSVRQAYRSGLPSYIRFEKGVWPSLYTQEHDFTKGVAALRNGSDVLIVSTGTMVHRAIEIAEALSAHSVAAGVVDLYRIKPLPAGELLGFCSAANRIITLEETSIIGGLGSIVAELLIDAGYQRPIKRFATPDQNIYSYGPREWILAQQGLDIENLTGTIIKWMQINKQQITK